jgi:hypothetical protein
VIGPRARREHGEIEEVAAVDRQLGELPRVDVAAQLRRGHVDERRFAGHRHRLGNRRGHHHEVQRDLLADEHLEAHLLERRKPGQFGAHSIDADADRDAEATALVSEGFELRARRVVHGTHGDTRQDPTGRVLDGAGDGRFLRKSGGGKHEAGQRDQNERPNTSTSHRWSPSASVCP